MELLKYDMAAARVMCLEGVAMFQRKMLLNRIEAAASYDLAAWRLRDMLTLAYCLVWPTACSDRISIIFFAITECLPALFSFVG